MTSVSMRRVDEVPDKELLARHAQGDPHAFAELVHRHRERMWAVALRTLGDPEEAADALQDACLSAFRAAGRFRGDAAVTTWLHRIVVNACLDRLRRNKVRAAQPLPDDLDEYAGRGAVLAAQDDHADPEAQAVQTDRRGAVLAALERLSPEQKAAVVLVDVEGYPVEEVARMLDCPSGTVKSRCARGRARLAVLLRESGITGTGGAPGASDPGPQNAQQTTTEPQGGART
jgi:RNA polymerase sigma-70 factor, ECF subfamily